ncbi:MAG: FAD-dependent oxidoreductase [Acetobacteraceae bacterium]
MTPTHDTEVVIAGGGPVGLGLAIELGQRGVHCLVIERYEQPQPVPKGQNLTNRTMEHFHFWHAEAQLRAARTVPKEYGIGGMTAYGTLLGDYRYDWLQRELVKPFYFTDNERLPQYATEAVLRARVAELPTVRTLYGWSVETIAQDADTVTTCIVERGGAARATITARYAAGCDGSRSVVREQAGITETKSDHDRRMVLLVFRSEQLHTLLSRFPGKSFYNVLHPDLDGYWQFFGRVDLGTTWFFHAPVPPDTTRDNYDFRALLHRAAGAAFDVDFQYIGFWDLRVAAADQYQAGRIFVAGDAAHSHPPYGGYGINTGFEDAANLGWKLAAVLRSWGGPALLASYDAERRPVFLSTARDFIERAISADRDFLRAFDPARDRAAFERHWAERSSGAKGEVDAFEPNYEGSPIVFGPPGAQSSAKGAHVYRAQPGHHLAPQPLSDGRNLFEALGDGFTLLALGAAAPAIEAFRAAAHRMNLPLTIITDTSIGGRERYEAALVLIRPDQFVAWSGGDGDQADAIVARVIGANDEAATSRRARLNLATGAARALPR